MNGRGDVGCSGTGRLAVGMLRPTEGSLLNIQKGQALEEELCLLEEKKLWAFQSKAHSQKNTRPQSGQISKNRWHTQPKGTPGSFRPPEH